MKCHHCGKSDEVVTRPDGPYCLDCGRSALGPSDATASSPTWREELEEARQLVLACARLHGERDAKEGVTIPPPEFCEDTKPSKMLREAWLEGWNAANVDSSNGEE